MVHDAPCLDSRSLDTWFWRRRVLIVYIIFERHVIGHVALTIYKKTFVSPFQGGSTLDWALIGQAV